MKRIMLATGLLLSASTFAGSQHWLFSVSADQPYFQSPSKSEVAVLQSPLAPSWTVINNVNTLGSAPIAFNASLAYQIYAKQRWHISTGLQFSATQVAVSGTGTVTGYPTDQYTYRVGVQEYDVLTNMDYYLQHWDLGGALLLGMSRLDAHQFVAQDASTYYPSQINNHFNAGLQLHALYQFHSNLQAGVEAGYRIDGKAKLGARANVYKTTGTISQTIAYAYIGLVFGVRF